MADTIVDGSDPAAQPPATLDQLRERGDRDVATLDHELAEIELLVTQARAEAARHETRRGTAVDRMAALVRSAPTDPAEIVELNNQLVTLTKRAALMDAQVEVLEGKAKVLRRYREGVAAVVDDLTAIVSQRAGVDGDPPGQAAEEGEASIPAGVSRLVLGAQEDLRREIARAMHDGPAQSLTNIVLQAQIVERLLARDPEQARSEVRQLVSMVQQTLEATKSFIFDVRPMVLDDLGLVPTLRRTARDRGRRAQIPVEFESLGLDRRLPMDLESGLFRLLDEAVAAFLSGNPDRVMIRLDWGDRVVAIVKAERADPAQVESAAAQAGTGAVAPAKSKGGKGGKDGGKQSGRDAEEEMLPALAAMIEDRRADSSAAAAEEARRTAWVPLLPTSWREIQGRAAMLGILAELFEDGTAVRLIADLPAAPEAV